MPTPGTAGTTQAHYGDFTSIITGDDCAPATKADIDALRNEIAALKNALSPPSSIIITGSEVREFFRRTP